MIWTDDAIAELRTLRRAGLSFREIARKFEVTRDTISNADARHVRGVRYPGGKSYVSRGLRIPKRWTEEALTETWAARKARRQAAP